MPGAFQVVEVAQVQDEALHNKPCLPLAFRFPVSPSIVVVTNLL